MQLFSLLSGVLAAAIGVVIVSSHQYMFHSPGAISGNFQGAKASHASTYEDFLAALRMRESSGNSQSQNQYGARGAYQFHEAALKQIGWYTDNTPRSNPGDDWIGAFTSKSGVTTIQQFLNSPTSQDNAMKEWSKHLMDELGSSQFRSTDYIGKTVDGIKITATGLIGGAHLWGVAPLDRYLDSGGAEDPRDPFGTALSEYVRIFSGYQSPFDTGTPAPTTPPPAPTMQGTLQ
jgi:hypothetical protein